MREKTNGWLPPLSPRNSPRNAAEGSLLARMYKTPRSTYQEACSGVKQVGTSDFEAWQERTMAMANVADQRKQLLARMQHMRDGHHVFCSSDDDRRKQQIERLRAQVALEQQARREMEHEVRVRKRVERAALRRTGQLSAISPRVVTLADADATSRLFGPN